MRRPPILSRMTAVRRFPLGLLLALSLGACAVAPGRPAGPADAGSGLEEPRELVVLVHGMGRTRLSMVPLEMVLERAGYEVMNWGYSSFCCSVAELLGHPERRGSRVHFVGHSLGNIIIRWVLAHESADAFGGRVVMLAPPNRGSAAADRLSGALGWLLKPLPELTPDSIRSVESLTLPPETTVGVVAGRYDWKVSVPNTRVRGMESHVVVPAMHTFIMLRPDVHRLVLGFLSTGEFP